MTDYSKSPQLTISDVNSTDVPLISTPPWSPPSSGQGSHPKVSIKQLSDDQTSSSSTLNTSKKLSTTLAFLQAGRESDRGILAREVTKLLQERQKVARLHRKAEKQVQKILERRKQEKETSFSSSEEDNEYLDEERKDENREEEDSPDSELPASKLDSYLGGRVSRKTSCVSMNDEHSVAKERENWKTVAGTVISGQLDKENMSESDIDQKALLAKQALKMADDRCSAEELAYRLRLEQEKEKARELIEKSEKEKMLLIEDERSLAKRTFYILPKNNNAEQEIEDLLALQLNIEECIVLKRKKMISLQLKEREIRTDLDKKLTGKKISSSRFAVSAAELLTLEEENRRQVVLVDKYQSKLEHMKEVLSKAEMAKSRTILEKNDLEQTRNNLQQSVNKMKQELLERSRKRMANFKRFESPDVRLPLNSLLREDCAKALQCQKSFHHAISLLDRKSTKRN